MADDRPIRLFHLPFSFMLPQKVATENGYFEEEGLKVELVERDREEVDVKYIPEHESLTRDNDIDLYPACKWESIRRTWDLEDGKVVANGTFAEQPYAVFTRPDASIDTPSDLADVPVAVNRRTGQEYTAFKAFEEYLPSDQITLEHYGMPTDRLRALRDGEVDAATLLDPHATLAEQLGFTKLLEVENQMGIVGSERVDRATLTLFLSAYSRAATEINAHPDDYRDQYIEMLEKDANIEPKLFDAVDLDALGDEITIPRYHAPESVHRETIDAELEWMKRRSLIGEDADVDAIVAPIED